MMKKLCLPISSSLLILSVSGCIGPTVPMPNDPPAAPTEFTLVDASDRAVFIKWIDNADNEDSYLVRRSTNADFASYEEFSLESGSLYFRDKNDISAGSSYFYRVLAVNAGGSSAAANTIVATTEASVSIPPGKRRADHTIGSLIRNGEIPISAITNAKAQLRIAYGHTSHGSQLTSGMSGITAFANSGYLDGTNTYSAQPDLLRRTSDGNNGSLWLNDSGMRMDCGYYSTALSYEDYAAARESGETPSANWEYETRYFLGAPDAATGRGTKNSEYNVVIWSWCGQSSGRSESEMTRTYLDPMSRLESQYFGIKFVYMTGHLNGDGSYHTPNDYIRDYCAVNNKWLFDFADIESYDPDGICYTVGSRTSTDGCVYDFSMNGTVSHSDDVSPTNGDRNWGSDWQADHVRSGSGVADADWYDCGAAHSRSVNANMKAYAAWWLWCRLAGWDL